MTNPPPTRAYPIDPFDVTWRERLVVLGSLGLTLLAGWALGMTFAPEATLELAGAVTASFFAVGKFLPLWGLSGYSSFSPYELGIVIGVMDTCSVLLIVYGLEGFYRIRAFKRALTRVQDHARLVLTAYPRMRKVAVLGVMCFVMFPVAGTGAVAAAFVGVLLGMHRAVLMAAVSAGGFIGGLGMAFVVTHFGAAVREFEAAQQRPEVKYLLIGSMGLVLLAGLWLLNRAYRRALARAQAELAEARRDCP